MMRKQFLQMFLVLAILCGASFAQERQPAKWGNSRYSCLVWNERPGAPLFVREETGVSQLSEQLIYKDPDLSVSLLQPLSFNVDNKGKRFIWWVTVESHRVQQMVYFRAVDEEHFVDASLGVRLQDLGKLKLLHMKSGAMLLYTSAGDGQLRLVSVTNPSGQHLLIDYGPRGAVERIRDDGSREARLEYAANKIGSMVQTWYRSGSKYLTMATFK